MRNRRLLLSTIAFLLFAVCGLRAQMENRMVSWELLTPTVTGKPGEVVNVKVRMTIMPKSHLYTSRHYADSVPGPQPTEVTAGEKEFLALAGEITSDLPAIRKVDPNFNDLETEFWEGSVTLTIPVKIAKTAKRGEKKGWVDFYFMTCDDKACKPPTDKRFEITVRVRRK